MYTYGFKSNFDEITHPSRAMPKYIPRGSVARCLTNYTDNHLICIF